MDEDDHGQDIVRRIPARRVHYVERSVEEFQQEVKTLFDRVEAVATRLQTKIPIGGDGEEGRDEPYRMTSIPIQTVDTITKIVAFTDRKRKQPFTGNQ